MSFTVHRRITAPLAVLAAAGLALAGCSAEDGSSSGPGDAGEADGVVTIYSSITEPVQVENLEKSWADWEKTNKIDIKFEGSKDFEKQIPVRAQGGNAPDLAIFPQPGLLADLASRDYIQPAPEGVSKNVKEGWSTDWAGYGTVNDTLYGAPLMASIKGFVWYSPAQFTELGVEVPETYQELLDLTATLQQKLGKAPWCAGFGSDAASGWPGTDWVEDLVLREAGAETYDKWVKHEIPFDDPAIKSAFDSVGKILLDPKYVNAGFGDVKSINSTQFGEPARALGDGSCALHHQASFYDEFLQDPKNGNATVGPDAKIWAFIMPGKEAGASAVTGGGEVVGAFSNDADTIKVQEYLSSADWANSRVKIGGQISANKGVDPENASSPILQEAIKVLQDPKTTFRFDGSDLMPSVVGAGSFWKGMVSWIDGKSTDEVLSTIEASWPEG
ncbi:MAG: ABC transporter substrate-binding protein [Rhodoglobus sp.]